MNFFDKKDDKYWKRKLTPEQYSVLREKGTEPAFCGLYWNSKEKGMYHCAACNASLFSSDEKFDSGTGWPSFTQAESNQAVTFEKDLSRGMVREEVLCGTCGSHLGHVFDDGPPPDGKRYCINSVSLKLIPKKEAR